MRRIVVVSAVAVLLMTACGEDAGSPVVEPPATDAPAATDTATGGPSEASCTDLRSEAAPVIEMQDFRFVPSCVQLTTSQGFGARNTGQNLHNLSIEGVAAVDVDTEPGQENNYEPPGLDADVYTFFCKYHRSSGMEGELRVVSG